ncbi:Phytochrome A-associated F-box protein [Apostasia shenzhenica]|uniref:Phytochrome A-associated F-box protein n=1 Tax=Apostasia shenzhenica TaxID=1088818 RepID=A0A2I0AB34_9ASPA|nr:Phytochrome A-associated F-box protein [Apostasia shenzhenica]
MVKPPASTTVADTAASCGGGCFFDLLSDDIISLILDRLSSDPRDWSRLACVSSRFSKLIGRVCFRSWCFHFLPSLTCNILPGGWASLCKLSMCCPGLHHAGVLLDGFSREEGSKLLASRFRSDCLYICQWPGCVHEEKGREYLLFRGIFKDFQRSCVWQAVNDAKESRIGAKCAFCRGKETWDLHSAFCLRRGLDFHGGEPIVRAYVCENGHVSGAWVEKSMYL